MKYSSVQPSTLLGSIHIKKAARRAANPVMSKLGELFDHSPRQVSQASKSPMSNKSAALTERPKVITVKIQPELPVIAQSSMHDKPGTISIFLRPKTNNFKPLEKSEQILSAQKRVQS